MLVNRKGFTLIELLVVIAILATLAVTVFVAMNPAKRLRDSRDAKRKTDVATILDGIHTYVIDNQGFPTTWDATNLAAGTVYEIVTDATNAVNPNTSDQSLCNASHTKHVAGVGEVATAMFDIGTDLSDVLAEIPVDANNSHADNTGYTIEVTREADGSGGFTGPIKTITIASCGAENEAITISR